MPFFRWLSQARADFKNLMAHDDIKFIIEKSKSKLAIELNEGNLTKTLGFIGSPAIHVPKDHKISSNQKPWTAVG